LARVPTHAAVVTRRHDGRFLAAWLVDPHNVSEISFTIAALKKWHPRAGITVDLSNVNKHRVALGESALDERGLPIYGGEIPDSAEDTAIGEEIKDLMREFTARAYSEALA
jgi:hypothetical protein